MKVISTKHVLSFIEEDVPLLNSKNIIPRTCVQLAGDIIIVPDGWSHAILSLQDSLAIGIESKKGHWNIDKPTEILNFQRMQPIPGLTMMPPLRKDMQQELERTGDAFGRANERRQH